MKIIEITEYIRKYVHPDVNTQLKKIEKRATGKSRMGYHSMMAYPFRVEENIDPKVWTELRAKGLVKPMEYDTPEARAAYKAQGLPYKPDISIITKHNMDTLSPERKKMLKPIRVSDQQWIDHMNKWWREERPKPEARDKTQQIKNAYKLLYKKDMVENFADGKKKGKSRPGRVKRSGASCKGSVTSLRAKARKYSGEKGKMYHWCANMKGGRKKK